MTAVQSHLRKPAIAAVIALGVLFIGAIIFYKERILFADASYFSFTIINSKKLAIQTARYGSIVTQVFPYLGAQLNMPLKVLLMAFSASFYLFNLIVASLLVFRYKEYILAISMALFYFLLFSQSYFWVSEIPQAVSWMFLFYGTTLYLGKKQVNLAVIALPFLLLGYLTISTHFVVLMPTVFLWVYLIIEKNNWPFSTRATIVLSGLLVLILGLIFAGSQGADPRLHRTTHFSLKDIIDSFTTPVIYMFLYRCIINYWIATAIFIIGIVSLIRKKQTLLLTWTLGSCLGYFIIMGLTYGPLDKNVQLFHIESEWQGISIIFITPFMFNVLPNLRSAMTTALLSGVFMVRLMYIGFALPAFQWRLKFQEEVLARMQKKNITKLAIINNEIIRSKYLLDWGLTYETILASALNGDRPQRTFMFVNPDDKKKLEGLADPKLLYNNDWDALRATSVSNNYFSIDTLHPYTVTTYEQLFSQ